MTENQIKEYERLSNLKRQYEKFIAQDGTVSIVYYSSRVSCTFNERVNDDEFKRLVKALAKQRLENINKQIEKL